jgi:ribosomal protein S18 acetylase RimI-like enzyme|uniref:N-alpha-acetyltransferase 40 n=1 Tax=Globisporangium ultimum (strain ATCC 200006 / CBS 805.95 / DAOM BR144) TaxID=431595 RepID=K3X7A4_GLOUD
MGKKTKKTKSAAPLTPLARVLVDANAVADVLVDFPAFTSFARNGVDARIANVHASQLDDATRNEIVALFEANMQQQYEASDWGYDAAAKRQELFEPEARYLVAYDNADSGGNEAIAGFVHFRFVDDDDVEVLYVYEIQVAARMQRKGLGKFLMQILLLVARRQRMKLVVLTVFKANAPAMAFYRDKMGFAVDETSPSASGDNSASYEILSKVVDPTYR